MGMRTGLALAMALAGALAAGAALAEPVPETAVLGDARITLIPHDFLTEEEIATLRVVMTNAEALSLFVPGKGGFAALAVNPEEGFIREGTVVKSAVALAELPDADTAAVEALKACEAAKAAEAACVVVLTVEPAG